MSSHWDKATHRAVASSIVWQLKGFQGKHVVWTEATKRVLRDSLRKIKMPPIGITEEAKAAEHAEKDHVVPIDVIARILYDMRNPTEDSVKDLIGRLLFVAILSKREHNVLLRELTSRMPTGWEHTNPAPDNHLARYRAVGINLDTTGIAPMSRARNARSAEPRSAAGEKLPLLAFYPFAEGLGYEKKVAHIKARKAPASVRCSDQSLRRGLAVNLLEQHGLLDQFIDSYWHRGREKHVQSLVARWKQDAKDCDRAKA